ncbi:MAG TPA: DUF2127 domain-containing protein [Candidatus Acidoferrum sp.]|jgi:uncharacterized membrane protein (DUF2068 family)|nr:DUF2127 domain-containing protein [Candidatus Acidoferrum sp.]
MSQGEHRSRGLLVIAAFKLLKGLALLAVGIGAHTLIDKDLVAVVEHWVNVFRVDPNNHYLHALLERFTDLSPQRLKAVSFGTFFYAVLLLTEGVGLAWGKRWAEYFTIIATSSFIPLEIYEIFRHTNVTKVVVLLINVAVVWYLVLELRRHKEPERQLAFSK